ncbi:MAG: GNAT family N-acetyltransferase [Raoultibacter sp.]
MDVIIAVRAATDEDLPTINVFAAAEGMGVIETDQDVYVAVNESDEIVGFIRLVFDGEGVCHVNPVVVYPTWRGFGVGRALTDLALAAHGELRLVSRGSSLAFYQSLGFEPIAWDLICEPIVAECDGCELMDECKPVPMRKQ